MLERVAPALESKGLQSTIYHQRIKEELHDLIIHFLKSYPVWNHLDGSMTLSVCSFSPQYPIMTQYPRMHISPGVFTGTIFPSKSTIFNCWIEKKKLKDLSSKNKISCQVSSHFWVRNCKKHRFIAHYGEKSSDKCHFLKQFFYDSSTNSLPRPWEQGRTSCGSGKSSSKHSTSSELFHPIKN